MTRATPLERAIARRDWDAAALYALVLFARVLRDAPETTFDDLLAVLAGAEVRDDTRGR
jgi:hypothetical protein